MSNTYTVAIKGRYHTSEGSLPVTLEQVVAESYSTSKGWVDFYVTRVLEDEEGGSKRSVKIFSVPEHEVLYIRLGVVESTK